MENQTYADIVNNIKTFKCGLKDVSADGTGSLQGTRVSLELVMYKTFNGVELNEIYSLDTKDCDVEPTLPVEIEEIKVNEDGERVIILSDGTEQNLGKITGEKGEKGDKGMKGEDGVDGNDGNAKALSIVAIVISAIAVIIMLYVAIVVTSKLKRK
ncbi:MAG: hypothetical protein MJ193_03865, partial [Clostridia bacterium]|nr:hypothetical protein [Clostridia bacterium]